VQVEQVLVQVPIVEVLLELHQFFQQLQVQVEVEVEEEQILIVLIKIQVEMVDQVEVVED
jgi:hypothetical protein